MIWGALLILIAGVVAWLVDNSVDKEMADMKRRRLEVLKRTGKKVGFK